jgi:hypothetical protein
MMHFNRSLGNGMFGMGGEDDQEVQDLFTE